MHVMGDTLPLNLALAHTVHSFCVNSLTTTLISVELPDGITYNYEREMQFNSIICALKGELSRETTPHAPLEQLYKMGGRKKF